MLQSLPFKNRLFQQTSFTTRILAIVIDETYCISHWGADFRKAYSTLGVLRAFLPRDTSVLAMSATITPCVYTDLERNLQLTDTTYINEGNNRPNISLVVRACEHSQESYMDLDFVIPQNAKTYNDIPKTWIYVDNISTGAEIIDHLSAIVQTRYPTLSSSPDVIDVQVSSPDIHMMRPFNAVMSLEYWQAAMDVFRQGVIWIIVCTDAAGMVGFISRYYLFFNLNPHSIRVVTFQTSKLLSNGSFRKPF